MASFLTANRIKVLQGLQQKAERSVEAARLKAQKLEEINKLKELELLQHSMLLDDKGDKERAMMSVVEKTKDIGRFCPRQAPIESVFDNTIGAIKMRIEKKRNLKKIIRNKTNQEIENLLMRDRVVAMERGIRDRLRREREASMEKLKASQAEHYKDMQRRLKHTVKQLRELEVVERNMLQKLHATRSVEHSHIQTSVVSLNSIQSKQSSEDRGKVSIKKREHNKSLRLEELVHEKFNNH